MIFLYIYLIGVIIVFVVCKVMRTKAEANETEDVVITIFLSLGSILGIVILFISYSISPKKGSKLDKFFWKIIENSKLMNYKYPKWM